MNFCAPLTNSQSNNASIRFDDAQNWLGDVEHDDTVLEDDFFSVMSSFNGDWTGAETSEFEIGIQTPAAGTQMLPSATAAVEIESDASNTLLQTLTSNRFAVVYSNCSKHWRQRYLELQP